MSCLYWRVSMLVWRARRAASCSSAGVVVGLGLRLLGMAISWNAGGLLTAVATALSGIAGYRWSWATPPGLAVVSPDQTIVQHPRMRMPSRIVDGIVRGMKTSAGEEVPAEPPPEAVDGDSAHRHLAGP